MRIVICGSSSFKKEMIEFRDRLNEMGHKAIVNEMYDKWVRGEEKELWKRVEREHGAVKSEYDFMKWYYNAIVNSDAILVLNLTKNGVENYIGGNTLMEMGFAFVHDKKIFQLNPIPEIGYRDEIEAMKPVVINGNLEAIR